MNNRLSILELKLKKIAFLNQWYADDRVAGQSVTLTTKAQPNEGYLKTYVLGLQSGGTVGEIDIPKDFLVKNAQTIYVEASGATPMVTKVNGQAVTPYAAPSGAQTTGIYLDFIINVASGTTVSDKHVCVNMGELIDVYTGDSGITVENNTISVSIADNGGLKFNGRQLKLDVNTNNPNGLGLDSQKGLMVDLAAWNQSTSAGTNGAMSADDKRVVEDNDCDILYDYELATWFGYGNDQDKLNRLSGVTDNPFVDYSTRYFTIVPTANGSISFSKSGLQYSTDKQNWNSLGTSSLSVTQGEKVYLKGTMTPSTSYPQGIGKFSSTNNFNVEGNAMSLLYGDNYIGQTSLSGKPDAFNGLFSGCTHLVSAENLSLPATTLASACYSGMFYGCTSLTTAPELPATTLAQNCYHTMFEGCTSLTTAPELPATMLADYCYSWMFINCRSLTTAPELPATTLVSGCYDGMFSGCTSLTTAPELPATTLAIWCYNTMFQGCTSLTTAPELPATTLADYCYYKMFQGCTSLTIAPELPATTLVEHCYDYMFFNCNKLKYIKCLATDISASGCTYYWVYGVSGSGTFIKDYDMLSWTIGHDGIPNGWTAIDITDYVAIVPTENGTISFSKSGLQYSTDKQNWNELGTSALSVTQGTKVYLKGTMTPSTSSPQGIGTFSSTNGFNVEGNAMSLLYGDNFSGQTSLSGKAYAFCGLFSGCTHLVNAEDLILPATILSDNCYQAMFRGCTSLTASPELRATTLANNCYFIMFDGCTSLTTAPELPATTLAGTCYNAMFRGCTSLTTAPELPATTLASACYGGMFRGCTSLTTAPELPATTLVGECYYGMFSGCTSLTTAPKLPATTLVYNCYGSMFIGCTSLNYIKCLATDVSANYCTYNWVSGVAASGTFVKNTSMSSWTTGNSGVPSGWVVEDFSKYFTIVPTANGSISFNQSGLQYSTDKTNWNSLGTSSLSVTQGTKVYLKGTMTPAQYYGIGTFASTNSFNVEGDVMWLLYGDGYIGQTDISGKDYAFARLFSGCTHLVSAENLILPATTLSNNCYCYTFRGCTSLTSAPALSATILEYYCYGSMFEGCTSLTTAPDLPATTLAHSCYRDMFSGCENLNYIKCLATNISVTFCTKDWTKGVAATGTFVKDPDMSSWTTGVNGIPNGWTTQNVS